MAEINKITVEELILIINSKESKKGDLYKKYSSWEKLDVNDLEKMQLFAQLTTNKDHISFFDTVINYWSEEYPIALNYIPNMFSYIYTYKNDLFMVYIEFGGHIPEKRCRYLDPLLIVY